MADFAYTTVPGKIKPLLEKIREINVPTRMTTQTLESLGYKSTNDRSLLRVLKAIGFVDANGVPTSRWKEYRGKNHKQVLGEGIREGYTEFFRMYSDAYRRSQTELDHVVSTNSSGGKETTAKVVSTFKSLVELAEFAPDEDYSETSAAADPPHTTAAAQPTAPTAAAVTGRGAVGPTLHFDIQIHISPEASADQIEQVFASMAKHFGNNGAA